MFRTGKRVERAAVSVFGVKLNLFGQKPWHTESHQKSEIARLIPKTPKTSLKSSPSKARLFDSSNLAADTFTWNGEIIKEDKLVFYVFSSINHAEVLKLVPEEEFLQDPLNRIKVALNPPSPR